jgi:hypothetical protein
MYIHTHSNLTKPDTTSQCVLPLMPSIDGQSFRWGILGGLSRLCLICQIWHPEQAEHKSNCTCVSVGVGGRIFLRCLHTQCQSLSKGQRWYVGTNPPSLLPRSAESDMQQFLTMCSTDAARKRAASNNPEGRSNSFRRTNAGPKQGLLDEHASSMCQTGDLVMERDANTAAPSWGHPPSPRYRKGPQDTPSSPAGVACSA